MYRYEGSELSDKIGQLKINLYFENLEFKLDNI